MSDRDDDLPKVTIVEAKISTITVTDVKIREIKVGKLTAGTVEIRDLPWAP